MQLGRHLLRPVCIAWIDALCSVSTSALHNLCRLSKSQSIGPNMTPNHTHFSVESLSLPDASSSFPLRTSSLWSFEFISGSLSRRACLSCLFLASAVSARAPQRPQKRENDRLDEHMKRTAGRQLKLSTMKWEAEASDIGGTWKERDVERERAPAIL